MSPTKLQSLYDEHNQSPWLDNLKRGYLSSGELERFVERGIRGITSNPSIFQKAISVGNDYDEQFGALIGKGSSVEDSYWDMVVQDINAALAILRPVYDSSDAEDGYVSIEVAPSLARDTEGTTKASADLWHRIDQPNLYVKIPGTAEGLPAIRSSLAAGINVNVTLLFSVSRYDEVIEAYLSGLEDRIAAGGSVERVTSVASFFVSRVDTEIDRRLEAIGTPEALALRGKSAVANAQLAYGLFLERFSGARWDALEAAGAKVQRPLWASTSTKNPDYKDTLYVDQLIGPRTVNTMPDQTIEDFDDHGTLARTVDADLDGARAVIDQVKAVGVDIDDVGRVLEEEGVAVFSKSFDELIDSLSAKASELA
ncbi:MAG: transaldolase [Acidimicrobiales bacterium]